MAEKLVQVGNNVVAFPDTMSDDEIGNILSGKTTPQPQQQQSGLAKAGAAIARQVGITGRAAYEGFTAPATAALEFGKGAYNLGAQLLGSSSRAPEFAQGQSQMLTAAGLPEPQTGLERAVQAGAQGMAGTASLAKLAPSVPALAQDLVRQVPASAAAGFTGQAAGEETKKLTGSDLAATIASIGLGGLAAGAAGRVAGAVVGEKPQLYTMDQVKQRGSAAYRRMDEAGVAIKPKSVLDMIDNIPAKLAEERMIPDSPEANTVLKSLNEIKNVVGTERVSFSKLERVRSMANDLKIDKDPKVARLGKIALDSIDEYIAGISGKDIMAGKEGLDSAVKNVMSARKDWRNASRASVLDDALNVAEAKALDPKASESELIRRGFINIASNKNKMNLFNEKEQNIIKSVAKGGSLDTLLTFASQFSPLRSKLAAAGSAYGATQSPALTGTIAGTGLAADLAQSAIRRNAAKQAVKQIASGQVEGPPPNLAYTGLLSSAMVAP